MHLCKRGWSRFHALRLPKQNLQQSALLRTSTCTQSSSVDPDYLHQSIVPTDHFQPSLPRLPVPKLEDTCRRYLKSQEALLGPDEYQKTANIVMAFQEGRGKDLHQALVAKDKQNKQTSYISGPWFDMYLKYRDPIVLNHNPFICLIDDPKPEYNDQVLRATNLTVSALRFMKTLRSNVLKPEVFHLYPDKTDNLQFWKKIKYVPKFIAFYGAAYFNVYPLDISQYGRLFNSTRIPRPVKDELYTDTTARHLVVLRKGHLYSVDVIDKDGNIKDASEILAHLKYINNLDTPQAEHPLAIFTSENRDYWAQMRDKLIEAGNEELLRTIDSGLFVLSLDDSVPPDNMQICHSFLHGDGSNRWFDKSFELMIQPDGMACVNMEHAWGDGVAVLRMMNDTLKDSTENPRAHPDTQPAQVDSSQAVRRLDFNLTEELKQGITQSRKRFEDTISTLSLNFLQYQRAGKTLLKKNKLSPDSFMQLAFQMGFQRQYGQTVATYESCSTAAFRHGRTETIRPATTATKKACDMFLSTTNKPSNEELKNALQECSKVHGQLTKEAAMGQGFDRHLFGMKHIALDEGSEIPDLFLDPAYARINHNILSTSTLSSPAIQLGGFAPVVPDGFGVGYSTFDDWLGLNVTCYPSRDVDGFLDSVRQSFDSMFDTLEGKN